MGFAIGAAAYVMGLSALLRFICRRLAAGQRLGRWQMALSYLFAWPLTVPIAAYGFADGGPPKWIFAATAYLPAALVGFCATLTAIPPAPAAPRA